MATQSLVVWSKRLQRHPAYSKSAAGTGPLQSLLYIWNVYMIICMHISKLSKAGNEKYSCMKYIISFLTNPDLSLRADFHVNISET